MHTWLSLRDSTTRPTMPRSSQHWRAQDPPETVLDFVKEWRNGTDIAWGARRKRMDAGWRNIASSVVDGVLIMRRYAMPRGSKFCTGSFLLMDRAVLDCFLQFRE
jgi:dolichol-phosphate mannosyltransferase